MEADILDHLSNIVCMCRRDEIVYANKAAVDLLGNGADDTLVGKRLSQFMDEDYGALFESNPQIFASESKATRVKLFVNTGEVRSVELKVRPIGKGDPCLCFVEGRDITDFIRASVHVRQREQRLQGIMNAVGEGIVAFDETGAIHILNPAAERLFGYTAEEVVGDNVAWLIPAAFANSQFGTFEEPGNDFAAGAGRSFEAERKDGTTFSLEVTLSHLFESRHKLFIAVLRDITERKRREERILKLAHYDNLTALPNRNLFQERLERALTRARRRNNYVALMFVDLDRFKPINDTFGHEAGDAVLRDVACRLNACIRASDTAARIGGDEFVVILEDMDDYQGAALVAEKIVRSLEEPFDIDGESWHIGASIGISMYPDHGEDADHLIRSADDAMYKVKERGRNAFSFAGA